MVRLFFSLSLFLSAGLLFVIQPMAAKMLLPFYGGTPAVWTVCMLFFQFMLLFAYGYTWLLSRFFPNPWSWRLVHALLILLSLLVLPVVFTPTAISEAPNLVILKDLLIQLGLPLFIVGSSAPLLQFAYSQTATKKADDPYYLYAASNLGSLLALLSYPFLIERFVGLNQQFHYWNPFFISYLILVTLTLVSFPKQKVFSAIEKKKTRLSWRIVFPWLGYSFIPCSLMLGVTFYITSDIAATPLFWVLPLALYLLSFVITFSQKPLIPQAWLQRNALLFIIFPSLGFILGQESFTGWQLITFHLVNFFMLALLCHGELHQRRAPVQQLTYYYFFLALGGVMAGLFNALLAPYLFAGAYEYPLVLTLSMFCIPIASSFSLSLMPFAVLALLLSNYFLPQSPELSFFKSFHVLEILALITILLWPKNRMTLFLGLAILLSFCCAPWLKYNLLSQVRNFYGVKEVRFQEGVHSLMSQSTIHGFQIKNQQYEGRGDLAYYGPAWEVVQSLQSRYSRLHPTILGVGTGLMACQFRKEDQLKMIDIDPQVIRIASDPSLFTYLRDCPPTIELLQGDGRLIIARQQAASSELLVIDAFSSDAIPTHLLTWQAFQSYQQILTAQGVILVHISNRHLRLLPVLTANGRKLEWLVLHKLQAANKQAGQFISEWVLMTPNEAMANDLIRDHGWRFVAQHESYLWTDDYVNIVPLLKWSTKIPRFALSNIN